MANHGTSPGLRLRQALAVERPLQLAGAINAYSAMLAAQAGFRAVYLSGAGVANASFGKPDTGVTTLADVCEDARRVAGASGLPLLVDADTGFGDAATCVEALEEAGAAGLQIEDQVDHAKRCGHLAGKELVSVKMMGERVHAAQSAKRDASFIVMARTDAVSVEGIDAAVARAQRYVEAGADMIFAEALGSLDEVRRFTEAVAVPVLVNLTEFGRTPLFTLEALRDAGAAIALYPLTAFRAMSAAAMDVYHTLRSEGTQASLLERMQSRQELYRTLGYDPHGPGAPTAPPSPTTQGGAP
ncbi:MAG: methylisocitrate lyase [Phycisphaeraceae bacterium]